MVISMHFMTDIIGGPAGVNQTDMVTVVNIKPIMPIVGTATSAVAAIVKPLTPVGIASPRMAVPRVVGEIQLDVAALVVVARTVLVQIAKLNVVSTMDLRAP